MFVLCLPPVHISLGAVSSRLTGNVTSFSHNHHSSAIARIPSRYASAAGRGSRLTQLDEDHDSTQKSQNRAFG